MHNPDGIDVNIPTNLAPIVCNDVQDVLIFVMGDCPPDGLMPFKYAINPGIPEEAAAGWSSTKKQAKVVMLNEVPTQNNQADVRSPLFKYFVVCLTLAYSMIPQIFIAA